ncbi:FtsX-like permease family protein [Paenibacillus psychroresistens]|uniref:FtsX-like permease family protein n=1 Tax=Paenibacillus psychroresistens TaxID=1778678 RepID=A0A6B8RIX7_9BACL|nr:ABC transporter permease [Paenibacillus psychroresistens]QGQ95532.1 FtsX-like permease family protein [Paenibacillus psychroresistens]
MQMLRFLYRKMWNNRWLTFSSFIGLLVAVAFTTSIPMYADGSLKRVIAKTLEEKSDGYPAGSLQIRYQAASGEITDPKELTAVDTYISQTVPSQIDFPYLTYVHAMSLRNSQLISEKSNNNPSSKRRQMSVGTQSGLKEQVEMTQGRMFTETNSSDILEAVVSEDALARNELRIGDIYSYSAASVNGNKIWKVKIVGAFKPKQAASSYWSQGTDSLANSLIVSETAFSNRLQAEKILLSISNWYYAFDLRELQASNLSPLKNALNRLDIQLFQKLKNTKVDISFAQLLNEFSRQNTQLQALLFTLAAPMLAMVFYFIVMSAKQSLERQRNDIAVLRSRGGSTKQIIWIFLLESLWLGGISLALGLPIGYFMAKCIGASNGFLSFVGRESIPVDVSLDALAYGGAAVIIAIISSVIPAVIFAGASIVGFKQKLARADQKPFWQRWFLDVFLLLAVSYGWYAFNQKQLMSFRTGLTTDQLQIQTLLFFIPALAVFALGLICLRMFPWVLYLIQRLGSKIMPLSLHLTLLQLSRSATAYFPIMLLLILTLGMGVYHSAAARTIDLNAVDKLHYQYGTDVIAQAVWDGYSEEDGSTSGAGSESENPIIYTEPSFETFRNLPGVEAAARVLQTTAEVYVSGKSVGRGSVMGIDNLDFSKVAWFRRDLTPAHPFAYLKLLGAYEQAALVSTAFAEAHQLKEGDLITVSMQQKNVELVVVGIIPYWPSEYPDKMPFFITNLSYLYDQMPLIPYDVWLKMKPDAKVTPLVEALSAKQIQLSSVRDVRNELITEKQHPSKGGVYGILSLGFLVSVLISLIGYVLYWYFNLSRRVVQFGILRATGLSRRQMTGMLLLEQIFTAGLSIALGIGIGKLIGRLFLPFLQSADGSGKQVPPFRIVFAAKDTNQLYAVVAVMMLTGAVLLLNHIRKLRVHQAIKLGEER